MNHAGCRNDVQWDWVTPAAKCTQRPKVPSLNTRCDLVPSHGCHFTLMDETRTFIQTWSDFYADCNKLTVQQIFLINLFDFVLAFITTNKYTNNIKKLSLYTIYTFTCFDISMSSSGSFTIVPCKVTWILKTEAAKFDVSMTCITNIII